MEWQLIETAPKDGTAILAAKGKEITTVFFCKEHMSDGGNWELVCSGPYAENSYYNPTHWMPLPPPPNEDGR